MDPDHDRLAEDEPIQIQNRPDTGGPWSAAGALVALGLIGLMIVQSCMPSATSPAAPTKTTLSTGR